MALRIVGDRKCKPGPPYLSVAADLRLPQPIVGVTKSAQLGIGSADGIGSVDGEARA
jgi:hypothetical protein